MHASSWKGVYLLERASLVLISKFWSLLLGWHSHSMNFTAVAKGLLLAPFKQQVDDGVGEVAGVAHQQLCVRVH